MEELGINSEELNLDSFDTRSEAETSSDDSSDSPSISSASSKSSKNRKKQHRLKSTNNNAEDENHLNSKNHKDRGKKPTEDDDDDGDDEDSDMKKSKKSNSPSKSPDPKKRVRSASTSSNTNNNNNSNNSTNSSNSATNKKEGSKSKSYDYMTKLNYLFRETRFFVIKSNNADNVTISKTKGVWSTLPQNESNLNQAYRESRNVLLIFSVKESGKFAGFARMAGESRRDVPAVEWVLPPGISAKALGGVFEIDWICKKELSFNCTTNLYNPWNDGKPVKIGRDGQEIEPKVAEELCRLFPEDETIEMTPVLRKSKEMAKKLRESGIKIPKFRRPPNSNYSRGGPPTRMRGGGSHLALRGRRKIFMKSKNRLNNNHLMHMGNKKGGMFNRMMMKGPHQHWLKERFPGSTTAAAEAYVADYMRTMQHQLPPMPYAPPPGFMAGAPYDPIPPPPPRYYDGLPIPEYPQPPILPNNAVNAGAGAGNAGASTSNYDKRNYEDFVWKNKNDNNNRLPMNKRGNLNSGGNNKRGAGDNDQQRDRRNNDRSGGPNKRDSYRSDNKRNYRDRR